MGAQGAHGGQFASHLTHPILAKQPHTRTHGQAYRHECTRRHSQLAGQNRIGQKRQNCFGSSASLIRPWRMHLVRHWGHARGWAHQRMHAYTCRQRGTQVHAAVGRLLNHVPYSRKTTLMAFVPHLLLDVKHIGHVFIGTLTGGAETWWAVQMSIQHTGRIIVREGSRRVAEGGPSGRSHSSAQKLLSQRRSHHNNSKLRRQGQGGGNRELLQNGCENGKVRSRNAQK